MSQAFPARRARSRVATHDGVTRASRLARENHQRFSEQSLRNSVHAHRGSIGARRQFDAIHRDGRSDSGLIGTIAALVILAVVAYVAYTFAVSAGLLT